MSNMGSFLYVYSVDNFRKLEEKLRDYDFYSIAHLFLLYDSLDKLTELEASDISNSIIDITNVVIDNCFHMTFTERYLEMLLEKFDNVHFCMQSDQLEVFCNRYRYLFDDESIISEFCTQESENTQNEIKDLRICLPVELYLYKNMTSVEKFYKDGILVPLSKLVDECEGMTFRYNIESISNAIEENGVKYIDISSIMRTLKIRGDLTFLFEVLLHRILRTTGIKYCAEESLASEITSLFPFTFSRQITMDDANSEEETRDESAGVIDIDQVNTIADKINGVLRGHAIFKEDFKSSLLKYQYLNKMGERKILSIFLCGDSGIGKTEFAKIVSRTMFPNEPLIKINFGNYSNEGVLNSLIGSPLGYVGSGEGGELINKINLSKSRIILIDEFERATPSVFNFFYELLEDGVFTDRHGNAHDLNGYIIILTSNMSKIQYQKHVPNALKSRFDMEYYFVDLPVEEKALYIRETANELIKKLEAQFEKHVLIETIQPHLDNLVSLKNLRDVKRRIEDIVFDEFFKFF